MLCVRVFVFVSAFVFVSVFMFVLVSVCLFVCLFVGRCLVGLLVGRFAFCVCVPKLASMSQCLSVRVIEVN